MLHNSFLTLSRRGPCFCKTRMIEDTFSTNLMLLITNLMFKKTSLNSKYEIFYCDIDGTSVTAVFRSVTDMTRQPVKLFSP